MRLKGIKFVLFLILAESSFVHSQSNNFLIQNFTSADGLPNNYIRCLYQDNNGYLWVGTRHGLSKFDGYEFTNYDRPGEQYTDPPYPSGIFEDSNLTLWVVSNALLFTYDPASDRFNLVKENNTIGLFDKRGNLWIPFNDGIYKIASENLISLQPSLIKLICREKANKFAVFEKINPAIIKRYAKIYNPKPGANLSFNELGFALMEDSYGMIWCMVHSDGVYKLNPNTEKIDHYHYTNIKTEGLNYNIVSSMYEDETGFWLGTDKGIDVLDKLTNTIVSGRSSIFGQTSINNDKITCLLKDRTGNLWVGSKYGLNKLFKSKFSRINNLNRENGFLTNNVISLFEDKKEQIWISTSLAIEVLNSDLQKIEQFPVREYDNRSLNAAPQYIYQDKQDNLWIGTWMGGLAHFLPESKSFEYFKHDYNDPSSISGDGIFNVFEDSKQNLWISFWTGTGIDLFDRGKKKFRNFKHIDNNNTSLSANFVSFVYEDRKSNLWVGTSSGLNQLLDKERGEFKPFLHKVDDSTSIAGDFIDCIFESAQNELWFGTDSGLCKFNYSTNSFNSFNKNNELPKDEILGILQDGSGNLWISRSNSISKVILNAERSEIVSVQNFDFRKINNNEFNIRACLKQRNGNMLFGGLNGIVYFQPDSIRQNLIPPKTVITKLKIFNKDVKIGEKILGRVILNENISTIDKIELSYKHSVFALEFAGLHFENSEANLYKYKLEGFDFDWTYTDASERYANYTNLDGGDYIFKVYSANSDGIWNAIPTMLKIRIVPPFWKTAWFKFIICLLIGCIFLIVIRTREYLLKRQKKELQKQVIARTHEVVLQKESIEKKNELLESQQIEILEQSSKIERMNQLLQKHNIELVDNIKELSEARVMQKLIDFNEFKKIFKNEDDCYKFLVNLKWSDGYVCKRCKSIQHSSKDPFVRRCRKCNYKESVTSYTIFHHLRFPIDKAFYILILTSSGREINISQLSATLSLRLKTCWSFHNKVKTIMSRRKRFKNPKEGWIELILLPATKDKKLNYDSDLN
jgi:ligand-binding sensor domain-containing protein